MNIIFDLDSTLTTIEGIDELGALRQVKDEVKKLTDQAMRGEVLLCDVFEKRLEIIKPNRVDCISISKLYLENITPNAKEVISTLKAMGHRIYIVTGGYEICCLPIARELSVHQLYANKIIFHPSGEYHMIDKSIPLWRNDGKKIIVQKIKKENPGKTIMIGDGMSDLEAGADQFIYFAGVVERREVSRREGVVIRGLGEILKYICLCHIK